MKWVSLENQRTSASETNASRRVAPLGKDQRMPHRRRPKLAFENNVGFGSILSSKFRDLGANVGFKLPNLEANFRFGSECQRRRSPSPELCLLFQAAISTGVCRWGLAVATSRQHHAPATKTAISLGASTRPTTLGHYWQCCTCCYSLLGNVLVYTHTSWGKR